MHYFPAWDLDKVMDMSWDNFVLFMASIPNYDEPGKGEEQIEEKDAWEIF